MTIVFTAHTSRKQNEPKMARNSGKLTFICALLLSLLQHECYPLKNVSKKRWRSRIKSQNIVEGLNNFGLRLYRKMPKDGNSFYSPFGIANALAMAFAGSGGKTRDEIANALGWNNSIPQDIHSMFKRLLASLERSRDGRKSPVVVANSVWVEKQERVQNHYRKLIEGKFDGKFGKTDFYGDPEGSRRKVNNWVQLKTKGTIKDLIPSGAITKETRVILANAVYFKASWQVPFDKRQTRMRKFHMASNKVKKMAMMEGYMKAPFLQSEDFTGIELPYEGRRFSMIVLLPNSREGIDRIGNLNWDSLQKSYQRERKMRIVLPKFKITARYELVNKLQSLGIKSLFSSECDLSAMLKTGRGVFVTNAVHKAFVVVNEEGTEASAATALFLGRSLVYNFIANRPFLFFIKDNTAKLILFAGRFSPS